MKYSKLLQLIAVAAMANASALFALSVSDVTDAVTKADEIPVPIRTVAPKYPEQLRHNHVQGLVSVLLVVDESGSVIASEVVKASHDDFRQPSLDAVQSWKFKPARTGGKTVKMRLTVPLRFTIED